MKNEMLRVKSGHRSCFARLVAGVAAAVLTGTAWGGTYTWIGTSDDFATGANWQGGVAPSSSDSDINLVFPKENSTITGLGTLTVKTIQLTGASTELQFGPSGGTLTVTGVISGPGHLTVAGVAGQTSCVDLRGNNTFTGGYFGKGCRTNISHVNALGTGPAEFASNGKPQYALQVLVGGTIANDITIGPENQGVSGVSDIGTLYVSDNVTFSGAVTFTTAAKYKPTGAYNANYRIVSGSKLITFTGPVTVSGADFLPAGGRVLFKNTVTSSNQLSYNGGGLVEFATSGNTVPKMDFNGWGSGDATFRISADNPFTGEPTFSVSSKSNLYGNKTLELNGHDVTLGEFFTSGDPYVTPIITSSSPAMLTVHNATANRTFFGAFKGETSFTYNSSGKTLTLTTANSTMTGALSVQAGAVVVDNGAAFPNLAEIEVANSARLQFTSTAGNVAAGIVKVGSSGTLDLGGRALTVNALFVNGELQPKGTYAAADYAWLAGEGSSITVVTDSDVDGYVWLGAAGGEWNNPGNWLKNGAVATMAPGASDTLYIGTAGEGNPFRVTTNTDISNPIVLGTGRQVFYVGTANTTLTLRGEITGEGGVDFKSFDSTGYLRLAHANTFKGGVRRNGPGQVQLWHLYGLGTGAFTVANPNGIVAAAPMSFRVSGTVTNDMTFLPEGQNGNSWNGAIGVSTETVHLTGAITFTGDTRIALNSGSKLYFDGETTVNGRLTHNSISAHIYFTTPVKSVNAGGYLHTDQGHGIWHLGASSNALSRVYMSGANADAKIVCEAENAFLDTAYIQFNEAGSHTYILDLGGFDQVLGYCYDSATGPATHYATSFEPATLTLKPVSNNPFTRLTFTDNASLDLQAAADKTFTLAGGAHTTRGKFRVSSGTLKLAENTSAAALAALEVADGAKLLIDASAGAIIATRLTLEEGAQLEVGAGQTLTVDYAEVNGRMLEAGTYTGVDWFTGAGSVKVCVTADPNLYIWTGEAGGEWNVAGNWSVNGAPATVAPSADKTLFIGAATKEHPFRVTSGIVIANPIILGTGQQYFLLGFGDGTLQLTGKITGSGGIQFDSANNAQYYAQLSGAENDFVGGVRRSGAGQLQVYHGNALGTGTVTLDDGSALNSGIANRTPLYVGQSCTIANDFVIGSESFASWNGWWGGAAGVTVHFTGAVRFWMPNNALNETRFAIASTVHFDGPVSLGGVNDGARLICKAGATAWFHEQIRAEGARRHIYADNESFTGYLCAPSNQLASIYCGNIGSWKWYLQATDALAKVDFHLDGEPAGTGVLLDLGGYDQHMGNLYYSKPFSDKFCVTSEQPATLTVNATANCLFGGCFKDAVSFVYDPTGDFTYTLSNAVHTTTGSVTVANGTLKLTGGAQFAKTRLVTVQGGTLELAEAQGVGQKAEVRLLDGGVLQLDAGTTTVANLFLGESDEKQAAGLWGAPGNTAAKFHDARIAGTGLLKVLRLTGGTVLVIR